MFESAYGVVSACRHTGTSNGRTTLVVQRAGAAAAAQRVGTPVRGFGEKPIWLADCIWARLPARQAGAEKKGTQET